MRFSPCRAIFKGTHITQSRGFTLSVSQSIGKLSKKAKSVVFAFLRNYLNNHLRFRKSHFSEKAPNLPHTCGLSKKGECENCYIR